MFSGNFARNACTKVNTTSMPRVDAQETTDNPRLQNADVSDKNTLFTGHHEAAIAALLVTTEHGTPACLRKNKVHTASAAQSANTVF